MYNDVLQYWFKLFNNKPIHKQSNSTLTALALAALWLCRPAGVSQSQTGTCHYI